MGRVEGKIAIVTGGASGLGEADVETLAREGAHVVVADLSEDAGRALAEKVDGTFVKLDVADEPSWQNVIAQTTEKYGALDILVNNAGISLVAGIEDTSLEQYRSIQRVNSDGVFLGCKYGLAAMGERGGSIINISSGAAVRGFPAVIAYSASKGAVRALSMTVAAAALNKGWPVRSNTVLPFAIATPLQQASADAGSTSQSVDTAARGKVGVPSDIANLVLYLSSDESKHITGQEFIVDGGYTIL